MTESEVVKPPAPPPPSQTAGRQQLQQVHQHMASSSSSSSLVQPNVKLDPKSDAMGMQLIHNFERSFRVLKETIGKLSEADTQEYFQNLNTTVESKKYLTDGLLYGILIGEKPTEYMTYMSIIAVDGWDAPLTTMNMLLLELFHHLRPQCRSQVFFFLREALKLNVPKLDSIFLNVVRTFTDGIDFKSTCLMVQNFVSCLDENRQWISALHRNSLFPASVFVVFARFISDYHLIITSLGNREQAEQLKNSLISICDFLLKERFIDLMMLGRDLVLVLVRLAKVPHFQQVWKNLQHNPTALSPKLTSAGLHQLMIIPPATNLLTFRVSLNISRKLAEILKIQIRVAGIQPANPAYKPLQSELSRLIDSLKSTHLNGPDSGSIRAEMIRHLWAIVEPKEYNQLTIEARAMVLSWLLKTAKPGAELQWCKLVLFWEWFGFDPSLPNSHVYVEPALSTVRICLQAQNSLSTQLGNSLIEFLIKTSQMLYPPSTYFFVASITNSFKALEISTYGVQNVLNRLDQPLKEQLRVHFPDVSQKRVTSIADNLAEPSQIIDFDAIRNTPGSSLSTSSIPPVVDLTNNSSGQQPINGREQKEPKVVKQQEQPRMSISTDAIKLSTNHNNIAVGTAASAINLSLPKRPKMDQQMDKSPKKILRREGSTDKAHHPNKSPTAQARKRKRLKSPIKEEDPQQHYQQAGKAAKHAPALPGPSTSHTSSSSTGSLVMVLESSDEELPEEEGPVEKKLSLAVLLPMLREEFRENLELLQRAVKQEGSVGREDDAMVALQRLSDSLFDADDISSDQIEYIALCLLQIFDDFLKQDSFMPKLNISIDDSLSEIFEQPLFGFFNVLCRATEDAESRKSLLGIGAKMRENNNRIGYLLLFFMSGMEREGRSSKGDTESTVDQVVSAYKDICKTMDEDWEKALRKDLEQCSFDDFALFSHLLVAVLIHMFPYGPPIKLIHFICTAADPKLMTRLMSEVVRENVVLFKQLNLLQLLSESLKWESVEQLILWQLIQTEAPEFNEFFEIVQKLNYANHPEATAAVMVIMRNMEPNPEMDVLKSLMRHLFLRPPERDLFTVDAIKLLVDYEDNVAPVADCIGKLVKKATNAGNISGPSIGVGMVKGSKARVLTVETIFGHLDRLRRHCMERETRRVEELLKSKLMLELVASVKRNPKLTDIRSRFDELFALFDILLEDGHTGSQTGRHRRRKVATKHGGPLATAGKGAEFGSREGTPKKKRRAARDSESDED